MGEKNKWNWIPENFKQDLVSVIIPTYNRVSLLKEALESIADQTYRPIECIVVDDGSTEDVRMLVSEFSKIIAKDFELKYIFQENAGAQVARNTGTRASSGEYIQYLDSDDKLWPNKISEQVLFLKQNKQCQGVFGDWEQGEDIFTEKIKACITKDLISQLLVGRCIANFSFLMTRIIVNRIGSWDENLKRNQEIDFHLRGALIGNVFCYQTLNCGLWRTHNNDRISTKTGLNELLVFFQKWVLILKEKNIFTLDLSQKLGNLLLWHMHQANYFHQQDHLRFLKKAIELNPELLGYNTSKKIKVLNLLLGKNMSFKLWSKKYIQGVKTFVENRPSNEAKGRLTS